MEEKVLITHKGKFDKKIINQLLSQLKPILDREIEDLLTSKRIYNISVECLENIVRHGAGVPKGYNLFVLTEKAGAYFISAGNILNAEDKEDLENIMKDISKLDVDQLKKKYRTTLLAGELGEKGGAGLGMYDIAIKSENNIQYIFKTISKEVYLFQLEIKI